MVLVVHPQVWSVISGKCRGYCKIIEDLSLSLSLFLSFRFLVDGIEDDVVEDLPIESTHDGKYCLTGQVR